MRYDPRRVTELPTGVVLRIDAKVCHVEIDGEAHVLPLRGKLFEKLGRSARPVAVGDRVRVQFTDEGGVIEEVLPRTSKLARSRSGETGREQVLAANVSLVLVTAALIDPPFQPELVDRILASAARENIDAVVVMTKVDYDVDGIADELADIYRDIGYRVFQTSIVEPRTEETLAEIRELLRTNISVLSGASGVGKSALINTICPGLDLRIGSMSRIRQGRHTTTHTQLIPLPGGGHVLDTPGIRSFSLFAVDPQEVQFCYPEIKPLVGQCAYRNCLHIEEPDCAVRDACDRGLIHPGRYASYLAILEELQRHADWEL